MLLEDAPRDAEAAQERQRRREEAHARGAERRREQEDQVRQRREQRRARAAAKAEAANATAASAEETKADAAKRVKAWSDGKDFFAMLSTLNAFFDAVQVRHGVVESGQQCVQSIGRSFSRRTSRIRFAFLSSL